MPTKPRHGRDYRLRTPHNRDLIQQPTGDYVPVSITQIVKTGDAQLTIDINCPITSTISLTPGLWISPQVSACTDVSSLFDGGAPPVSAVVMSTASTPGRSRIRIDYNPGDIPGGAINPTQNFVTVSALNPIGIAFTGRQLRTTPASAHTIIAGP